MLGMVYSYAARLIADRLRGEIGSFSFPFTFIPKRAMANIIP